MNEGTLYFFCGKMGAGKTTYAKELTKQKKALYLSEDEILSSLYPNEIQNFDDYISYSIRIKPYVKDLVTKVLDLGVSIVMDFPGNTKRQRSWFKDLFEEYSYNHELIYLKVNDELCLAQIEKRRKEDPSRHQFDTKEVFEHVTKFFEEPDASEGFKITQIVK